MRGFYVIYSHGRNAWYTNGGNWWRETDYITKQIPTAFAITLGNQVGGASASAMQYENVVVENSKLPVEPFEIKKFNTLNEAETYLLSGSVVLQNGKDFVTIRKIYYG